MKRFKEYLMEKTFNINKDVDFIFNNYIKKFRNSIIKGTWDGKTVPQATFSSKKLSSNVCKVASKKNESIIIVNRFERGGAFYLPTKKVIVVGMNVHVLKFISEFITRIGKPVKFEEILKGFPENRKEDFKKELEISRIKGSIHHELSHWLDDTYHGRFIGKIMGRVEELQSIGEIEKAKELISQGKSNVNLTFLEINAQIHAMIQLKRVNKDIWDSLTFDEMLNLSATFQGLKNLFLRIGQKEYQDWKKNILKRMSREKLLGKNMR